MRCNARCSRPGPILGYLGDPDRRYRDVRWIDDRTIVTVHLQGVEVYDVRSGEKTFDHAIEVPENRNIRASEAGGAVAFDASPDGSLAAVGTTDDDVVVIDLATGTSRTLAHQSRVYSLAFDPDGTELATGDAHGTVRLWDPRTGDLERDFVAHPEDLADFEDAVTGLGMVNAAVLSDPCLTVFFGPGVQLMTYLPDGSLITATTPVVRNWDPSTGEQLGPDVFPPGDASQFSAETAGPYLVWTLLDDVRRDPRDPGALVVASRNYGQVVSLEDGVQQSQLWYPTNRDDGNVSIAGSTFTEAGNWVVWLSDGRIRVVDEEGTAVLTVRPALRRPTALELDTSGGRLVGAADGGLVVVSLSGETLLADGIAKQVPGQFTTITDDGATVVESDFAIGPTAFHERSAEGWRRLALATRIATVSAEAPGQIGGRSLVRAFANDAEEPLIDSSQAASMLLDPQTGETVFSFGDPIFHDAVSFDQRLLAAGLAGLVVTVWDARDVRTSGEARRSRPPDAARRQRPRRHHPSFDRNLARQSPAGGDRGGRTHRDVGHRDVATDRAARRCGASRGGWIQSGRQVPRDGGIGWRDHVA